MAEDKGRLCCYISEDVLRRFRAFIARKNRTFLKGMLSYEVEPALKRSMSYHGRKYAPQEGKDITHAHINITDQQMAVHLRDMMVKYLVSSGKYEEPPAKVPLYMLKWAICAVTGVKDQRAIKSRLTLLESNGLIRQLDWISKEYAISYGHYLHSDGHMAGPPRGVTG
jgi:hypothetical protein